MIVRDAILSEEPYTLAGAAQAGKLNVLVRPVPAARPAAPALVVQSAALAECGELPAAAEPVPAPLTLAAVSVWLAEQDHDVLSALPQVAVELEEISEDAYTAGFNAGRIAGSAAAAQETARLHELLESAMHATRADCLREQERLAQHCVEIVAAAIEQIAGPLLATHEAAVGAVAVALGKVKAAAELSVRVNPADLPLLEAQRAALLTITAAPVLHLLADAQVALGGCLVESAAGTLDARLEVQLQGLFDTLRAARTPVAAP